jgi:DnaJ-class molecular chaperone
MIGAWIKVTDFLGKELQVRVPESFDPAQRLKVAKHGYSNWRGTAATERGDLYLRVLPRLTPLKDMDLTKVEALATRVKELKNVTPAK